MGGGDSALEEGIFLTRFARSITIIHRREELRAVLSGAGSKNPKIKFIWNSVVTDIIGDEGVKAVRIKNVKDGEVSQIPTDGIFVFIGHTPNSQLFENQLEMDARDTFLWIG